VHLVVLVEILQETLVDGVQVEDEKVVHGLIMAHHDRPRGAPGSSAVFKGRTSRANIDKWCTTPVGLRGKHGAVLPEGGNLHDPLLAIGEQRACARDGIPQDRIDQQPRRVGLVPVRQCPSRPQWLRHAYI